MGRDVGVSGDEEASREARQTSVTMNYTEEIDRAERVSKEAEET